MHAPPAEAKKAKTAFSVWSTDAEARALVLAGMAVLRRSSAGNLTVADVLEEAGLSTRAFYRHFESKDELILAVYQYDNRRSIERLRARIATATSTLDALEKWVEVALGLGFARRRARRTLTLWREGGRLWARYPGEYNAVVEGLVQPLTDVLERGRREGGRLWARYPGEYNAVVEGLVQPLTDVLERGRREGAFPFAEPHLDAVSIHAVVWRLIERKLGGDDSLDLASATAYVLRFCLPVLTGR